MAFGPRHPFIDEAVAALTRNLQHPEYLLKSNTREAKNEDSVTMRLTGPAMYQWTLHKILKKANCRKEDNSYSSALFVPERYCKDMDAFRSYFDRAQFFEGVNLDNTITHKVFYPGSAWEKETTDLQPHYDDADVRMREAPVPDFCSAKAFADRAAYRARQWKRRVDEMSD